ncbi:MAG: aldo/keto reductase, partial [Firmicutes bacterium]|nr:aldo/keto reductase [Bacillota bacterium]
MYYTEDRYGHKVSRLGFGCMRFKRSAGSIDVNKAEKEIMDAIGRGVNYFDTAYIYPGSEDCLGEVLERNGARDKVFIATKLPQYLIKNRSAAERYFKEELKRLRTDHVDFYLMHMLTDVKVWNNLCALGIRDWIEEKKSSGAIGQIGFSFHGNTAAFKEILEAYDWDFCQIQYNYVDEHTLAGRAGLEAARERGIPVVIME